MRCKPGFADEIQQREIPVWSRAKVLRGGGGACCAVSFGLSTLLGTVARFTGAG